MNGARASAGLAPLASDGRLASFASTWSATMAKRNTLVHSDLAANLSQPSWSSAYTSLGENLYTGGAGSAANVVTDWMASSAHRREILQASYDRVGVGV